MKLSLKGENQNPKYAFVIYLVWLHELRFEKKKKKKKILMHYKINFTFDPKVWWSRRLSFYFWLINLSLLQNIQGS